MEQVTLFDVGERDVPDDPRIKCLSEKVCYEYNQLFSMPCSTTARFKLPLGFEMYSLLFLSHLLSNQKCTPVFQCLFPDLVTQISATGIQPPIDIETIFETFIRMTSEINTETPIASILIRANDLAVCPKNVLVALGNMPILEYAGLSPIVHQVRSQGAILDVLSRHLEPGPFVFVADGDHMNFDPPRFVMASANLHWDINADTLATDFEFVRVWSLLKLDNHFALCVHFSNGSLYYLNGVTTSTAPNGKLIACAYYDSGYLRCDVASGKVGRRRPMDFSPKPSVSVARPMQYIFKVLTLAAVADMRNWHTRKGVAPDRYGQLIESFLRRPSTFVYKQMGEIWQSIPPIVGLQLVQTLDDRDCLMIGNAKDVGLTEELIGVCRRHYVNFTRMVFFVTKSMQELEKGNAEMALKYAKNAMTTTSCNIHEVATLPLMAYLCCVKKLTNDFAELEKVSFWRETMVLFCGLKTTNKLLPEHVRLASAPDALKKARYDQCFPHGAIARENCRTEELICEFFRVCGDLCGDVAEIFSVDSPDRAEVAPATKFLEFQAQTEVRPFLPDTFGCDI